MVHERTEAPLPDTVGIRRLTLTALAATVAASCIFPQTDGYAVAVPRISVTMAPVSHHDSNKGHNVIQRIGDGKLNSNAISINSPAFSRDIQSLKSNNSGGINATHMALCKKKTRCKFTQRFMFDP